MIELLYSFINGKLQCNNLIINVREFQAKTHQLSIIRPLLSLARQPRDNSLDFVALCRILNGSGYGFEISKEALFFIGHDTSL